VPATLSAGGNHSVTWTRIAATEIPTAKLELYNGTAWVNIDYATTDTGLVTNSGAYNWSIPATIACTACQFRLSDPDNAGPTTNLSNTFEIRAGLQVTAPTGAAKWVIGTSGNTISWTITGVVSQVSLDYSSDTGSTYPVHIATVASSPASYAWTIPTNLDILTPTQAMIKVSDASLAVVYDESPAFMMKSGITVTKPTTGDVPVVGTAFNIEWTTLGTANMGQVSLKFSKTGSAPWTTITGTAAFNSSPYTLWAPAENDITTGGVTAKIRIEDNDNATDVSDDSDAFAVKGTAAITSPSGSAVWVAGATHNIVWDRTGAIGNVDLLYSVNDGTYQTIATDVPTPAATDNAYGWLLPSDNIISNNVKVRIQGANMSAAVTSPAFSVKGSLALSYPDVAGIMLSLGDSLSVTWNRAGDIGPVKVEYYDGSAWTTVTTTAPQNGPYAFTLDNPATTLATSGAKVRVTDADNAAVTDESANTFTVRPLLAFTEPNGDEAFVVGTTTDLTWTRKGSNVTDVKLEYSKNSGANYNDVIAATTENDGAFTWAIPDDIQSVKNMKVRISSLPTSATYATTGVSAGLFQIVGALQMSVPSDATGVKWRIGSTGNELKWNATGSIVNVKLEYSTNSGTDWSTVVASTPSGAGANKSYSWDIPNNAVIAKDTVRFKALDAANTNVFDTADANSSLLANFTLTHPVNPDEWIAETSNDVTWTTSVPGTPANVKLEYDLNDTNGWQVLSASTTNSGTKSWTLGTTLSQSARVRISDVNDVDSLVTGTPFKIRGDLVLTAPNTGTESWEVNTIHAITWTKKGAITAVKLQLTTDADAPTPVYTALVDGDAQDTQNISVSGVGPYTFNWRIPDIAGITSTKARIRVVDASDAAVLDASNANFTIKGRVDLLTPNGGQTLTVGVPYSVTGSIFGPITSVKLFYSTNGGSTYDYAMENCATVAVVTGAFSCNWAVPDRLGPNVRVRVEDAANALVFDESAAVLSIKGSATITAPVSGNIWIAGDAHNIIWDRTGTIGNVDLLYSVNDGVYQMIAGGVPSPLATGNTFGWTLPTTSIVTTNLKVKIDGVNLVAPAIAPAITVKGKLTLDYPDAAGITMTLGDNLNVQWTTAGDIGPVKVEYFDGSAWSTITTTAPQNGPHGFALDTPATTVATVGAKIRISDADDATVIDTSANAFTVRPLLAVTSPTSGDTWLVNTVHAITWNYKGSNVTNVKLEYSNNNFSSSTVLFGGSTPNDGTENWTVPDDIQSVPNLKMKISSLPLADPYAVTATSNGLFQIVGGLTVTQPSDATGVKWRIGSTANEIKWDATGSVVNVKIDYSTNSGGSWLPVIASTPSGAGANKSYSWNIPASAALAKDTMRIRVADAADTNIFDVATANSSLLANFAFTAPTTGQVWVAETSNDITWNNLGSGAGSPTNVKLEYNLGASWQSITNSTLNSGGYSWPLGTGLSTAAKVRISDAADVDSLMESQTFKIRGDLVMTAPNTGLESWEIGTVHAITWTKKGDISTVKLQFSNNGDNPVDYAALVDGDGANTQSISVSGAGPYTFNWKIPDIAGMTTILARIRVVDGSDSTVYDPSNANFTIKGRVDLLTPNGGETLTVGVPYTVTGSVFGPIASVKLYYSTNGTTYDFPMENCNTVAVIGGTFTCDWSVPDRISTTVKVKVEDSTNTLVSDTSAATLAIKGTATITSPIVSSVWIAGDAHDIIWNRNGTIGNVDLLYSVNNGSFQTIASNVASPSLSGNTFSWTLPSTSIVSSNVKVRISGTNLVANVDSPAFTVKGKLTLQYPDAAGIVLTLGDTANVSWIVAGDIGPVKVEYYNGSAWSTITTTAPQAGPFGLLLDAPNTTLATTGAKVRISDPDDATVTDESANGFTVLPLLALTAPSGNEAWVVNSFHDVTWSFKGTNVTNVKLEYSNNGGSTFTGVIAGTTPNDGTHNWQMPDEIQAVPNMKVRILSLPTSDPYAVTAVSSGLFKIIGALAVTSPQAPDKWLVGSTRDIKWTRTGSIANVRITYSTDGTNYNPIVDTYPGGNGDTGYPWTIPNAAGIVSPTATVRIADVLDSSVNNVSPQFKIVPSFTVTAPAANDRLIASRQTTVTWDRLGLNPTVNLYYSKDGFSGAGISIAAAVNNTGSYTWNAPDDLSNTVTLRVTYPDDETVFDDSGVFKVVPGFAMVAPNAAADKWDVGSNQTIRWTSTSANSPTVRLDYSTDAGLSYPFQITASTSNAGAVDAERTFAWNNLPDTITDQFKVKVSSTADALAFDTSDFSGKIKAFFDVLTPSAPGVVLTVNQPYDITWDWTGTVPNVRLDYSKTDFVSATNIAVSDTNDGVFEWTVPDDISATVKIRVRSVTDVDAFDISNNAFKIQGAFQVLDPNGGDNFDIGFPHTIRWQTTGSINTVNLVAYSTLPGDTGFPYTAASPYSIAAGLANTPNGTKTYSWNPVPDLASPRVRVRVIDANDATVLDDSDADFRIRGSFTMVTPNGGETFTINSVQTVSWNKTGSSITQALLRYSTVSAAGPWTAVAESEGTPNDGIITNDGSFDWTVPDAPSPTVWMRVEDPNDVTVFDMSNNPFRIRVGFVFLTPSGGERWVTNEMRTVSWNTTGSTTIVNLLYSTNNFSSSTVIANGLANVTGLNSYGWEIPNTLSNTAKLRLVDANDPTVTGDSNTFTLDHYQITFEVRDLLTNNHLDVLAVNATENTGAVHPWDEWVTSGLTSPFTQGLPAGAWTATFSRNQYGDQAVNFVADRDQTVTVFMETEVVHIWEAITDLAYNTNNDSVAISTTLRRDGSTVPGAISCAVKFYDAGSLIKQFTQAGGPDAQGFYNFNWTAPTGLVGGKVYNVVTTIGIATGGVFNTPRTFTITTEKKLQDVQDFVGQQLDVPLSQVSDNIQSKLDDQSTLLDTKLDSQTNQIQTTLDVQTGLIATKLDEFSGQVASSIISLEDAADRSQIATSNLELAAQQSLDAAESLDAVGKKFAGRLLVPQTVLMGETTTLRYRGGEGLVPLIDVFGFDENEEQVYMAKAQPMTESPDEPGLYTYEVDVTADNGFISGQPFTVFVQEATTGNFEAGSVYVQSVSLDSIQGMIAGDTGAKRIAQDTLDLLNGMEGQLGVDGELGQALEALKTKMERIPKAVSEEGSTVKMRETIAAISQSLTNLAGNDGYDFSELVKKGLEESPTIGAIREKTDEVQGATEVMQILMENKLGGVDDPVVHVTYQ